MRLRDPRRPEWSFTSVPGTEAQLEQGGWKGPPLGDVDQSDASIGLHRRWHRLVAQKVERGGLPKEAKGEGSDLQQGKECRDQKQRDKKLINGWSS